MAHDERAAQAEQELVIEANVGTSRLLRVRSFVAAAILLVSLLPKWGSYDYTSSLHPNSRGHMFTGLDAVRQQLIVGCLACMGFTMLFMCWLLARKVIAKRAPVFAKSGWGWDFVLLGIFSGCTIAWLRVLTLVLAQERDRFLFSSIWYKDLSSAFWLFPVALLLALGVRFIPLSRKRTRGQSRLTASVQPVTVTSVARADSVLADEATLIGGIVILGWMLLACSLAYMVSK